MKQPQLYTKNEHDHYVVVTEQRESNALIQVAKDKF